MCSYNRLNGEHASQNRRLLTTILRDEWGFDGVVVSDWGAVHTTVEAVEAGLDLEMPGPANTTATCWRAAGMWQVDEEVIEQAARRMLRTIILSGRLEQPAGGVPAGAVNTPAHQSLARELAEEAITLLKNNHGGLLPLDASKPKSIAVIGPAAADMQVSGGGSSRVQPPACRPAA